METYRFFAKNRTELDICLKMLYGMRIDCSVKTHMDEKDKIGYYIFVNVGDQKLEELKFLYKALIG